MQKIDFVEKMLVLLAEYSGRTLADLQENWETLLHVHGFDFNRAMTDLVSSSLYR